MDTAFNWNGNTYSAANGIQRSVGARLIESAGIYPDMKILDAGCGSGELTLILAEMAPDGHVTAVDLSASMTEKAEKAASDAGVNNCTFLVGSINDLAFDNEFDLVFSNSVLHWVTEISDGVSRFYRALVPGGLLAVQFPLLSPQHPMIRYANRAIRELGLEKYYGGRPFPWYVPESGEQFAGVLEKAGFTDISSRSESSVFTFPAADSVYKHFDSVGLGLFASLLPENKKSALTQRVSKDLKEDFPGEAALRYERIFASARKK